MNELRNRGVEDILIAVVDGLKGFPEAITAVFPKTIVQTCIVHLIRNSMDFASWKDRKPIAAELKAIYRATDADLARKALEDFDAGAWGRKYPAITQSWRRNWEHVIPFFAFPVAVRRIIYTTNAIESLNANCAQCSGRVQVCLSVGAPPRSPFSFECGRSGAGSLGASPTGARRVC